MFEHIIRKKMLFITRTVYNLADNNATDNVMSFLASDAPKLFNIIEHKVDKRSYNAPDIICFLLHVVPKIRHNGHTHTPHKHQPHRYLPTMPTTPEKATAIKMLRELSSPRP
jgi:hypothetical protein